ncbi:hypothetical protein JMJ77_0015188 [Colletotrichum scovillei]|uniref:Uncharacterized protein n=1 Tax=Colletotrichum scovillei TaxID=1209932 RepID=A0A9P7QZZ2_9PEZI|nr:hypothetical protein JMJ77_0015188 [Colletotrichum scovillei]KAG7056842.1 hypothetical protein JMJ78_0000632 [Colletotrichum scovillei]KAG7066739.1 hypothetical protein JMJ76_0000591 [Colletotrichum scovillei]
MMSMMAGCNGRDLPDCPPLAVRYRGALKMEPSRLHVDPFLKGARMESWIHLLGMRRISRMGNWHTLIIPCGLRYDGGIGK